METSYIPLSQNMLEFQILDPAPDLLSKPPHLIQMCPDVNFSFRSLDQSSVSEERLDSDVEVVNFDH